MGEEYKQDFVSGRNLRSVTSLREYKEGDTDTKKWIFFCLKKSIYLFEKQTIRGRGKGREKIDFLSAGLLHSWPQ